MSVLGVFQHSLEQQRVLCDPLMGFGLHVPDTHPVTLRVSLHPLDANEKKYDKVFYKRSVQPNDYLEMYFVSASQISYKEREVCSQGCQWINLINKEITLSLFNSTVLDWWQSKSTTTKTSHGVQMSSFCFCLIRMRRPLDAHRGPLPCKMCLLCC